VLQRPVLWGAGAVLLAAMVVYLAPDRFFGSWFGDRPAPADAVVDDVVSSSATVASGVVNEVVEAASAAIETVHSVPAPAEPAASSVAPVAAPPVAAASASAGAAVSAAASGAAAAGMAPAAGPLVLRATGESWVEVRDRSGRVLLSRTLQAGETVGVDGDMPLRATIGNAAGTQVSFRGQPVDVSTTRDNVARLELK
jgi:cytoskeleton protein RodZ